MPGFLCYPVHACFNNYTSGSAESYMVYNQLLRDNSNSRGFIVLRMNYHFDNLLGSQLPEAEPMLEIKRPKTFILQKDYSHGMISNNRQ